MSTFYKIGEIASLYNISTDILRYYEAVSYTHLDVYKRQVLCQTGAGAGRAVGTALHKQKTGEAYLLHIHPALCLSLIHI